MLPKVDNSQAGLPKAVALKLYPPNGEGQVFRRTDCVVNIEIEGFSPLEVRDATNAQSYPPGVAVTGTTVPEPIVDRRLGLYCHVYSGNLMIVDELGRQLLAERVGEDELRLVPISLRGRGSSTASAKAWIVCPAKALEKPWWPTKKGGAIFDIPPPDVPLFVPPGTPIPGIFRFKELPGIVMRSDVHASLKKAGVKGLSLFDKVYHGEPGCVVYSK